MTKLRVNNTKQINNKNASNLNQLQYPSAKIQTQTQNIQPKSRQANYQFKHNRLKEQLHSIN